MTNENKKLENAKRLLGNNLSCIGKNYDIKCNECIFEQGNICKKFLVEDAKEFCKQYINDNTKKHFLQLLKDNALLISVLFDIVLNIVVIICMIKIYF